MSAPHPLRRSWLPILHVALVCLVATLLSAAIGFSRMIGDYHYPAFFPFFRVLFYLQIGLLGGSALAFLIWMLSRVSRSVVRAGVFSVYFTCFWWLCVWGLIHRAFGMDMTVETLYGFLREPETIAATGISRTEILLISLSGVLAVVVLTALAVRVSGPLQATVRKRTALISLGLFLAVHTPVRAYFAYHTHNGEYVTLAYDDFTPLSIASEQLIPGLRRERLALRVPPAAGRARAYFDAIARMPWRPVPKRLDILWIVVDSGRYDGITKETTPYLWSHQEEFQLRLANHWSGGNSTRFGVFSMLSGLAGHHLEDMVKRDLRYPFFSLLRANGYRIRVANTGFIKYGPLRLFPNDTVVAEPPAYSKAEYWRSDQAAMNSYFADRSRRPAGVPAMDYVGLQAGHYPYSFPPECQVFQPAQAIMGAAHLALTAEEVSSLRNRYKNAWLSIDRQVERMLEDLKETGAWDNTIVVITGDHGEEFQERGQLAHSSGLTDFQGRTPLWIHLPAGVTLPNPTDETRFTLHQDIVPTLMQALGFEEDILYTQGSSLLSDPQRRPLVALSEQGFVRPMYHALVSDTHISRWRLRSGALLFSGVQRRDGAPVEGDGWLREVHGSDLATPWIGFVLPDVSRPPAPFHGRVR